MLSRVRPAPYRPQGCLRRTRLEAPCCEGTPRHWQHWRIWGLLLCRGSAQRRASRNMRCAACKTFRLSVDYPKDVQIRAVLLCFLSDMLYCLHARASDCTWIDKQRHNLDMVKCFALLRTASFQELRQGVEHQILRGNYERYAMRTVIFTGSALQMPDGICAAYLARK